MKLNIFVFVLKTLDHDQNIFAVKKAIKRNHPSLYAKIKSKRGASLLQLLAFDVEFYLRGTLKQMNDPEVWVPSSGTFK